MVSKLNSIEVLLYHLSLSAGFLFLDITHTPFVPFVPFKLFGYNTHIYVCRLYLTFLPSVNSSLKFQSSIKSLFLWFHFHFYSITFQFSLVWILLLHIFYGCRPTPAVRIKHTEKLLVIYKLTTICVTDFHPFILLLSHLLFVFHISFISDFSILFSLFYIIFLVLLD